MMGRKFDWYIANLIPGQAGLSECLALTHARGAGDCTHLENDSGIPMPLFGGLGKPPSTCG